MAKVTFSKLKCKVNEEIKTISFNDETIEVRQYLPVQEKLALIGRVVEFAHDADRNFSNPVKANIFTELEIVFAYTNLTFTDKQKEDIPKLYDMIASSGLLKEILDVIPSEELNIVWSGVYQSVEAIYKYQNSVLGVLDTINTDYSNMNIDIQKIADALKGDSNNLDTLKEVLTKLN